MEEAFPIARGAHAPLFLSVFFKLQLDSEGSYLTVGSSSFGVYESSDMSRGALFRYEYERDKGDNFPEAHLHVRGDWGIGNVEGGTTPRNGEWRSVLDTSRQAFYEQQLRALIRRSRSSLEACSIRSKTNQPRLRPSEIERPGVRTHGDYGSSERSGEIATRFARKSFRSMRGEVGSLDE